MRISMLANVVGLGLVVFSVACQQTPAAPSAGGLEAPASLGAEAPEVQASIPTNYCRDVPRAWMLPLAKPEWRPWPAAEGARAINGHFVIVGGPEDPNPAWTSGAPSFTYRVELGSGDTWSDYVANEFDHSHRTNYVTLTCWDAPHVVNVLTAAGMGFPIDEVADRFFWARVIQTDGPLLLKSIPYIKP